MQICVGLIYFAGLVSSRATGTNQSLNVHIPLWPRRCTLGHQATASCKTAILGPEWDNTE